MLVKLQNGYINPDAIDHITIVDQLAAVTLRSGSIVNLSLAELAYLTESTNADEGFIGEAPLVIKQEISLTGRIANYLKEQQDGVSLMFLLETFDRFRDLDIANALGKLEAEKVIFLLEGLYYHATNPAIKVLQCEVYDPLKEDKWQQILDNNPPNL